MIPSVTSRQLVEGTCFDAAANDGAHMPPKAARTGKSRTSTRTHPQPACMLSPVDVAEQLQVSVKTVRRMIAGGELRVHTLGRQLRVSPDDLAAFIKARRR